METARVCRALKTLPLLGLSFLLAWVEYASWISVGVFYFLVERGDYLGFALHSLAHHALWGLTVWSLVVTVNRGPGYVEKGSRKEQDIAVRNATPPPAALRSRRTSNASSIGHDSGIGDIERPEDEVALLKADHDNLPLDRVVQKVAEAVGFDAKEAHPGNMSLAEDHLLTAKADGSVRFCRKCQAVKPDRAHHCSVCAQCVLMMDHHCPWVATCVGHRNRKAFVLFLTYATLLSWYCGARAAFVLLDYTSRHSLNYDYAPLSWAFLMLLGFVFGFVLIFFTGYHWYLVCCNRTTLENMESSNRVRFTSVAEEAGERYRSDYALSRQERKRLSKAASKLNIFDMGLKENIAMVMGPPRNGTSPWGKLSWALPSGPVPGDGRSWTINEHHRAELERISRQVRRIEATAAGEPFSTSSHEPSSAGTGSTTTTTDSA